MKRRLTAVAVATFLLAASVRAADVVAPEAAEASGVPTVTVQPVPLLSISALSPGVAPAFGAAPVFSAPSVAAAPSLSVPAAAPALTAAAAPVPGALSAAAVLPASPALRPSAAPSDAPGALGQIERAAAPLAKPGIDAGEHLAQVFDSSAKAPALGDGVFSPAAS
ncbi:MAG TPA: hypothetical protein VH309_02115, partial [Elusimicrobiota bacterium]|nr:hypothetical protein [Elusimicrobiota bacterium]